MDWAASKRKAVRQSPECEARDFTMFKSGNLPLNMYHASDSFSPTAVNEQSVPSATRAMTSISNEDSKERIEKVSSR